jgi:hypothetical protein
MVGHAFGHSIPLSDAALGTGTAQRAFPTDVISQIPNKKTNFGLLSGKIGAKLELCKEISAKLL